MKNDKKTVSREIGLEIGSICGKHFLKLEHLHYGYWTEDIQVDIANLHIAQDKYTDFIISHIPKGAKKILDVGCGSGRIAEKMINLGYEVDCVSPSHYLAGQASQRLNGRGRIFESTYEQLQTDNRYDVILFCESFQYIPIEQSIGKTFDLLNPGGHMLICDLFKNEVQEKSPIAGGHPLRQFNRVISQYPFGLIEDIDITAQTAPNLDIINDTMKNAVYPTIVLTRKFLENRYPLTTKLIGWLYRKKIKKLDEKYFQGQKTARQFMKFKTYRFLLYQKTAAGGHQQ